MPPRPALEVSLLAPEPRHAVGGDETAGLPEPRADGRMRGPGREVLRDPEVRDEDAAVSESARFRVSRAVRTIPRTPRSLASCPSRPRSGASARERVERRHRDQEVPLRRPRRRRPPGDGSRGHSQHREKRREIPALRLPARTVRLEPRGGGGPRPLERDREPVTRGFEDQPAAGRRAACREDVRRRHRAVAAERQLDPGRRIPAQRAIPTVHARAEERGRRPPELHRDGPHRGLVEARRIGHDGGGVAREGCRREGVDEHDLDRAHPATLAARGDRSAGLSHGLRRDGGAAAGGGDPGAHASLPVMTQSVRAAPDPTFSHVWGTPPSR